MTIVQPATLLVKATFPQALVAIRPHLWLKWAKIAIKQERRTAEARAVGAAAGDAFIHALGQEVEDSMQAVAAVRHCLHNLWRIWLDPIDEARRMAGQSPMRKEGQIKPTHFTTDLPTDIRQWKQSVKELIGKRDEAVHHDEETAPTVPHPFYPTNVSGVDASFSLERVNEAVDLMMDILRQALQSPSPALVEWATGNRHVLDSLVTMRATGQDF